MNSSIVSTRIGNESGNKGFYKIKGMGIVGAKEVKNLAMWKRLFVITP